MSLFHDEVMAERQKYNFPKDLIGNLDEMPLYFDMVPCRTVEKMRAKVRVKSTVVRKRHVTVILACLASGKTLPPMIIFKGKSITCTHKNRYSTCSTLISNLHKNNTRSRQETQSSPWLCPRIPEKFLDDGCSDVPVGEGDLVQTYD